MRIEITGDESINQQARSYAEYRLFAALSQVIDTRRVTRAALALRRAAGLRNRELVLCTVSVGLEGGEPRRVTAAGDHPYAAINRAIDRLVVHAARAGDALPRRDLAVAE